MQVTDMGETMSDIFLMLWLLVAMLIAAFTFQD